MKDKKILVINQFNSDNLGDQLLNQTLVQQLNLNGFKTQNVGYAQTTKQEIIYKSDNNFIDNFKVNIKKNLPAWIKYQVKFKSKLEAETQKIKEAEIDGLVIGGGQLLKSHSVFIYCFKFWIEFGIKHNIPIYIFGIGIDDNLTKYEKNIYERLLSKATFINCRDVKTANTLVNELKVKECKISPDIAFTFSPSMSIVEKEYIVVMPYHYESAVKSFSYNLSRDQYYKKLLEEICPYINLNTKIILTSTTSSDAMECLKFKNYLTKQNKICEIKQATSIDELVNVFSKAKLIISGRMHAMIVANVCNIPVIPILISSKIKDYANYYLACNIDFYQVKKDSLNGVSELIKQVSK